MKRGITATLILALVACKKSESSGSSDAFVQPGFDVGKSASEVRHPVLVLQPGVSSRWIKDPTGATPREVRVQVSHFPTTIGRAAIPATVVVTREFDGSGLREQRVEFFTQDDLRSVWILGAEVGQFILDGNIKLGDAGTWLYEQTNPPSEFPALGAGLVLAGHNPEGVSYVRRTGLRNSRIRIESARAQVRTPVGTFTKCLRVLDRNSSALRGTTEPLVHFFAPGIGLVLTRTEERVPVLELQEIRDEREPEIIPELFVNVVDNPLFPLVVGQVKFYSGTTAAGVKDLRVETLAATEAILGVDCASVETREFLDGVRVRKTLDYYAQDPDGRVWLFGRDVVHFVNGEFQGDRAGSFRAGEDGAEPATRMLPAPRVHDSHRLSFAPGVAEEVTILRSRTALVDTPFGIFPNSYQFEQADPLEPGAQNTLHYFFPGVGLVQISNLDQTDVVSLIDVQ